MRSRRLLALLLLFAIMVPGAFADSDPTQTACEARVTAGLIKSAVVGIISDHAQREILCGSAKSDRQAFELGSISKSFAGIALAKLSLGGRIDLEAPLSTYVPELQGTYMGTTTTHQLATHTSLLVRSYSDRQGTSAWSYDATRLIDFLKSYRPDPVTFPAGTRSYSNVGFGALALVLSRIERKDYSQVIRDEVLSPLGMADTGFILSSEKPSPLVQGYDVLLRPADYFPFSDLATAHGGVYSDLHDMLIYLSANLRADSSSELGRAMRLSQILGLGWDSRPGTLPIWKNGLMASGFGTLIQFDPTRGLGSVVLGNVDNALSIKEIGMVAMGNPDHFEQTPLGTEYISAVLGRYVSKDGLMIEVRPVHGGYLAIEITNRGLSLPARLLSIPGEDSKFWVNDGFDDSDQISFEIDPATMRMHAVYFESQGKGPDHQPVFESQSFLKQ